MSLYNTAAIAGINKFLWAHLQSDLGWTKIGGVNGIVPIVSPQQEPELSNQTRPFIVFDWAYNGQDVKIEMFAELAGYAIFADDITDAVEAMNLMVDLFRRFDLSAYDVNAWISANGSPEHKKYDYKQIHVLNANSPEPAPQEGGRHEATVMLSYTFTVPLGPGARRFAFD